MTQIRLTNPVSPVNLAMFAFGTYEELAEATNTSVSTVKQWRAIDKVPSKHLPTLASKSHIPIFDLFRYCKAKKIPATKVKPVSVIDALINEQPHETLDETRRKQLLTVWGDRLTVLRAVFEDLTQQSDTQADYKAKVERAACELGVEVKQIYRLMRTFSVKRPKFKVTKLREDQSKETKERINKQKLTALDVIKGQISVVKASKAIEISERQVFRHVTDALIPYHGVNLTILTRYPKYFRMAVASEIEQGNKTLPSMKIKAIYDQWRIRNGKTYNLPKNLKRASYRDKLIAVLTAEISLQELHELADTPIFAIEEAFDRYCAPLGMSWSQLKGLSIYHQAFFAEILKGSGDPTPSI